MKKLYLFILFIAIHSALWAQSYLRGTILGEDNLPLPGAYVHLEETNYYSTTDFEGQFEIYGIPSDTYMLAVDYIGYEKHTQEIQIQEGQAVYVEIKLDEGIKLDEVILNANVNAQAKAFNSQKNSNQMVQMISGEQVEKYPDANIGDALKRISGINVQYDQGEARFANIRGTAPQLSSVTVNGERVPSAEAEIRSVQLDLIPSDMISSIEVFKAVTPDMDADAIGGTINLETQKAPAKELIKGTIGSGYSFLAEKPVLKGKLLYSNRFNDNKVGLTLEASVLDKHTRSDDVEPEWDYLDEDNKDATAYTNEIQIRQYYVERLRKSFSATLDFDLNKNHNIYLRGMYNHRNDWENRFRYEIKDIEEDDGVWEAELVRQSKGGISDNKNKRLEDQRMFSFQSGGDHFFGNVKMDWSFSAMKASEERPNERYVELESDGAVPVNVDFSDLREPQVLPIASIDQDLNSSFELSEITEEYQYTEDKDINTRINLELPLITGVNASFLKVGTRFKMKTKERDNDFYEYEPVDEATWLANAIAQASNETNDNYQAGDYVAGSFVSADFVGNLDLTNSNIYEEERKLDELGGNFNASEDIFAGYLMYRQNFGEKVTFIAGARVENTQIKYQGKVLEFDEEGDVSDYYDSEPKEDSYTNILPGFHIKFSPAKNTNFRFAWTNTIARPNYYDLVPAIEQNDEDEELYIGNPELKPTTSMNFDLLGEHFFSNVGILSAGVFYKKLTDVIANQVMDDFLYTDGNLYELTTPINLGDATLYGFEIGVQRRLDFFSGFLNNLSVAANYTYNKSELKDIKLEDREDETLPLVGTPNNLINASLAYDSKKLELRVSYSFADQFIEEFDDEAFYDRWYDKVNYLDINGEYEFHKNWKFYVSLENLLNQPLRYYQGIQDRTMQAEYYGVNAKAGVKFKF